MKRVLRFSRYRLVFAILSGAILAAGVGLFAVKGVNYGIDFRGGLSQQIQIAPVALRLTATGADSITASSYSGERQILGGDAIQFVVVRGQDREEFRFPYADYPTVADLAEACRTVSGVSVQVVASGSLPSTQLFPVDVPVNIVSAPLVLSYALADGETPYADIVRVRGALSDLGEYEVQTLGSPVAQRFLLKVGVPEDSGPEYRLQVEQRVKTLLGAAFQPEQVLIRSNEFVGPTLAGELAAQTISVVLVALALMLIYLSFRFRFEYAFSIILTVVHDSAVMFTVALALGLEFSTSVVAAILTIIGYSVNDTIVIFDRVRENQNLMRDADERLIFDTSLTQTLGRTLITSFVTLLSVVALYIFTTGSLKDFSLLMIVGIVVGSYSTIYIASPIVMLWHRIARRAQRDRDTRKFGAQTVQGQAQAEPRVEAAAAPVAEAAEGAPAASGGAVAPAVAPAQGTVVRQQPSRKKKKRH